MKVSELIEKLEHLQAFLGDVEVEAYSDEYCMDCHEIIEVTDGWCDDWKEHNDKIGICVR